MIFDPAGHPVEPIVGFLEDLIACGNSAGTVRSYAYDLLRWWRWLQVIDRPWNHATHDDLREYVLWLMSASKKRNHPRGPSATTAGTINPITRKQYLDDQYKPRTIRHSNAVLRSYYEWTIRESIGPLVNPVQMKRTSQRPNSHHNPLDPFRAEARLRYNPPIPKRAPRVLPDEEWVQVFTLLKHDRDRALLAIAISNGARAGELLGMRQIDVDWGEQLIRVIRKGTRDEQWLPVSSEAMLWLRRYLAELGSPSPNSPLWWTIRASRSGDGAQRNPMTYEALRALFRRINAALGTNWSMHDLRHTAARRMAADANLSLSDVQTILGHRQLSTTVQVYLHQSDVDAASRVLAHLHQPPAPAQPVPTTVMYRQQDLSVLFDREQTC